VRRLAAEVGTSTRAVYSVFGSMDGFIGELGAHAFDLLGAAVGGLRVTNDPQADLVEAGLAFRDFACSHPTLFRIAVQRTAISPELAARFRPAAQTAMVELERRVARLEGALGGRPVPIAAAQFHALCEGLAALELRGALMPSDTEGFWRSSLTALVAGFAVQVAPRRKRRVAV
jgi:AcrR family transcriptional regulator